MKRFIFNWPGQHWGWGNFYYSNKLVEDHKDKIVRRSIIIVLFGFLVAYTSRSLYEI